LYPNLIQTNPMSEVNNVVLNPHEGRKKAEYYWFALYTAPRAEKKVSDRLSQIQVEHYLPLIRKQKIWSDRKKWVEEPLFRSYLFVHISEAEYFSVLNIYGAVKFVSFGGQAVHVPQRQIESIKRMMLDADDLEVSTENFEVGMPVRVTSGPLTGLFGEIIKHKGKTRLLLRIHALESVMMAEVSEKHCEPAAEFELQNV